MQYNAGSLRHIIYGNGAPNKAPTTAQIGFVYIDQTNKKAYIAVDTQNAASWIKITP